MSDNPENTPSDNPVDNLSDDQKVKVQVVVEKVLDGTESPGNSEVPLHSIVINQDGEPIMTPVEKHLPLDLDKDKNADAE